MNRREPPRTRLRFFQFSLLHLLALFAAVSLLLGILAPRLHRAYERRELVKAWRELQEAQATLEKAVRGNDVSLARGALEAGANPNAPLGGGESLLHIAVRNGHVAMMELLLDFGADVEHVAALPFDTVVMHGPPLYAAMGCHQPVEIRIAMIRLLVDRGADPRREVGSRNTMDVAVYDSDAQMADLLREYGVPYGPREMAAFHRLDELKRAVDENPDVLRKRYRPTYAARPGKGPTLLGVALARGHREMAEFLIESGAPLDTVEYLGQTPLHMAARGGDPELIRLLVARGLDVNARDDYDDTPLCDVAWRAKPAAVAALIEANADVNARGMNESTPLHHAVHYGRTEIVRLLLAAGADPTVPDIHGKTALDVARERHPEMAKLLEDAVPAEQPPADK
jgi:cytohesin